jgi:hypothetical protein
VTAPGDSFRESLAAKLTDHDKAELRAALGTLEAEAYDGPETVYISIGAVDVWLDGSVTFSPFGVFYKVEP